MKLSIILWGMVQALRVTARVYPGFADRLKERNLTAQFKLQDNPEGRWIKLKHGRISSKKGIAENPDLAIVFKNRKIAEDFLTPPFDHLERIDAAKNVHLGMEGPDELTVWFMTTLNRMLWIRWRTTAVRIS